MRVRNTSKKYERIFLRKSEMKPKFKKKSLLIFNQPEQASFSLIQNDEGKASKGIT